MNEFVFPEDAVLAGQIAAAAAQLLLTVRGCALLQDKALGKAGDRVAHEFINSVLETLRPDDGLLSEEGAQNPARLQKRRVWIVDPLDGTREYSEGREDFAVHIALTLDGVAVVGAVALPALDIVYNSATPPALPPAPLNKILISRSRPPAEALAVAEALGADITPMGSAGAKVMALIRGEAQAYIHSGGQYEWDSAAPVAVAAAAGLHVSRLDGSSLRYNQADPYLPDLLVARPDYAAKVLAVLAKR